MYREADIRTLGLGAIHTLRRNYPPEKGAHIAIRKFVVCMHVSNKILI